MLLCYERALRLSRLPDANRRATRLPGQGGRLGFLKDLFGPREPCALCRLGQESWPSDRSATADWKLRGQGLQAALFICVPCRRLVMNWGMDTKMPVFALARMVAIGHAERPPVHAYLQHPEWRKIWMHMLEHAGVQASDEFEALNAIKRLEEEIFSRASQSGLGNEPTSQVEGVDFGPTLRAMMREYGIPEEMLERKYMSYFMSLRMTGQSSNWNDEIDEHGRSIGALTEQEIEAAKNDMHQAILNRIKVALVSEGWVPVDEPEPDAPDTPYPTNIPDEVLDAALSAWVREAGEKFRDRDRIREAQDEMSKRWWDLASPAKQGESINTPTWNQARYLYRRRYGDTRGDPQTEELKRHMDGWIAGTREVFRLFAAYAEGEPDSSYEVLLARAKADPGSVDYLALRKAYVGSEHHNPYAVSVDQLADAETALKAGDSRSAMRALAPILDQDYLNPKAHLLIADALGQFGSELGRETGADWHRSFGGGLGKSILDSASGRSPDDAYWVISISEEYFVLEELGVTATGPPSLHEEDNRRYDVFTVGSGQMQTGFKIYFQVNELTGNTSGLAQANVPADSPEYGGVLIAMAQQSAQRGDYQTAVMLLDRFIAHVKGLGSGVMPAGQAERFVRMAEEMKRDFGRHE